MAKTFFARRNFSRKEMERQPPARTRPKIFHHSSDLDYRLAVLFFVPSGMDHDLQRSLNG